MADAIVSEVVGRIATMLEDKIRYEVNLVRGVKDELRYLSEKLKSIQMVLDDAEKRGVKDESVKRWLKKLEATAYEMDDILDEWNYYSLLKDKMEPKQKIGCSFIRSSCLCFKKVSVRRDIAKKTENVKAMLEQIYEERKKFDFVMAPPTTDPVPTPWRVQTTPFIDLTKVHGVDIHNKKEDIVSKLMLNGGHTQVLSIVGTGGLGKTTLAKLVYNDERVKDCFELRIWICVSDPFDVAGIAIGIVNEVGKETIPPNSNQLTLVLKKLEASISGNKFLLVLDDVWTEDNTKWEPLKISLQCGAAGSKILVTTRKETVAKMVGTLNDDMYHPNKLSEEECWSLLCDTSLLGKSDEECGKFEVFGKKIARKCNGLPLAAVVLGTLLQFKDLEGWKDVEKSEIWQLENAKVELFPHLVLSYNDLSPALKRCFSYCAVYPKDHQIHARTLIEEWMAQGYLGSDSGNGALELKGRENLRNLAMRCLIQDIEKSESGEQIERCKMHDIVHDFAMFLRKNDDTERSCQACDSSLVSHVQEYRSLPWDYEPPVDERDGSFQVCNCMKSLRVLRIKKNVSLIPVGIEMLIHLRCLDFSWIELPKDDLEIICRLYFLQTLLLSCCGVTVIPREIGNLNQLRRLDLSMNGLEVIPQEIGNLVKLRELDLSHNYRMKELPESICSLVELQILKIEGTRINCVPEALGELSNLHTLQLCEFKVGSEYNKLGFLKTVYRCLTESLRLEIYWSSMSEMEELVEDARRAELQTVLQKLKSLNIYFRGRMNEMEQSSSSSMWMEVAEALVPHHNLKKLVIRRYEGSRLPDFMSSPHNYIKEIHLTFLSEVSSLPAMGKLPFLEILQFYRLDELMFVGREFIGIESSCDDVVVAFPKLEVLNFSRCSKWEEWEDMTEEEEEEEESAAISIMPCLTKLTIRSCTRLKKLPHRLLHKVSSSLQSLSIIDSAELVKTYGEDKEGSGWRSISQHNPQLQLKLRL
ncbi:putative disease resistance protein RGA1 isoform X3 [Salvia splendens]|uniref:putative disease resistance protein RGA1 isoform X3 n=1 Tax=Salvia splendens TaxID=180675 RepID=UPI001C26A0B9|nr:putative disease resistance protein RGA1 isoform X3 [Salvia splendens]XP_042024522.1 putative disease resistance protein RGA1 isoform X3 [Salvia splendens]XP_042024524.1 putative disease resistance protein RGA1 isoform X3 [Salvia splendens]XP_042024525.1 putative disease resistance protein RGA1 isoform X3 [Salvia splendens]